MNFLFVCTGNTCRSPMAEALLKKKLPQINVKSAGIFAHEDAPANSNAIEALKEKNIQLDHSAQMVTKDILMWADIILTMTIAHKQLLLERFPEYKEKYFTLIEYTAHSNEVNDQDIDDPFGGDISIYRKTLSELETYMELLTNKIKK